MRPREFIALLASVLTASPFATLAQKPAPARRIGVPMNLSAGDPEAQTRIAAFMQGYSRRPKPVGRLLLGRRPRLAIE